MANNFLRAFILILSISGCSIPIPQTIKNSFTYCYNGSYTGLDTLVNIDGYYKEMIFYKKNPTDEGFLKDTSICFFDGNYHRFMFYDNGMYVYNLSNIRCECDSLEQNDVALCLKEFSENSETIAASQFYGNFWGSYIICGDTIKVQEIYKGRGLNDGWHLQEEQYKIIDKNTLLWINAFNLPLTSYPQSAKKEQYPITFVPIPAKPEPDKSWILKEKWFWCDECDWKHYKDSLRMEKRNRNK